MYYNTTEANRYVCPVPVGLRTITARHDLNAAPFLSDNRESLHFPLHHSFLDNYANGVVFHFIGIGGYN